MKPIHLLYCFCFVALSFSLSAHELPDALLAGKVLHGEKCPVLCNHAHKHFTDIQAAAASAIVRRPYDILAYDISLDWSPVLRAEEITSETRQYTGVAIIRLRIDSADVPHIELDADRLRIDAVSIDGTGLIQVPQHDENQRLRIPLEQSPAPGTELELRIEFTNISPSNIGFFVFDRNHVSGGFAIPERIAYTLGAPIYARNWIPCNDAPYDKARLDLRIKVPEGYTVAANGLLEDVSSFQENEGWNHVYHWSDTTQIATYLMAAHASKYYRYSDWYRPADRPNDSIEVQYYVWEQDLDGSQTPFNAQETFANTVVMMDVFARQFGPYPFAKYGMAVAEPFSYGAMENQTMVTVGRNVLRLNESTVAHELMHMWLGDQVTPATWNDIWINEGGATYGEALWAEAKSGKESYRNDLLSKAGFYLRDNGSGKLHPACYRSIDPFNRHDIYNYAITYAKGAWIYHMLRQLVGDDVFFTAMQNFISRHSFGVVETADLLASLEQDIPPEASQSVSMQTFFDQWVYQRGHPLYALDVDVIRLPDNQFRVHVDVRQIQTGEGIPDVFVMPLELGFETADGIEAVHSFLNDKREQRFSVDLPFMPTDVVADPNIRILTLRQRNSTITGIYSEDADEGADLRVWPNPLVHGEELTLSISVARSTYASAEVFNLLGERIAVLQSGVLEPGTYQTHWNCSSVPAGSYLVRVNGLPGTPQRIVHVQK